MGSYNRITIALFLLICLVSVGRGAGECRGDAIVCRTTTSTPTPSTPATSTLTTSTPTTSTPTTSTPTTSTPTTSTPTTSIPTTSTPTTSTPTTSTPTTSTPTTSTPTTSTPTTSTPTTSTPTPSTSTLHVPLGKAEVVTEVGTTIITEETNWTTLTQQNLTTSTSAPDSTNGITQNAVWTTVSREAKPTALGVTSVHSDVTEVIGIGTGVDVSTGVEGFTRSEVHVDVTSDGVDTTAGPLSEDLSKEGTTVGSEEPTNRLTVITTDYIIPTSDEWPTALQDGDVHVLPSTSEYTDTTNTPIQEIPGKVTTTDSEMLTSALTTALGEQSTTYFASTPETVTSSDHGTTTTLITSEGQTTSLLLREIVERSTTAPLQTSPVATSERASTSLLHTSLPPATSERLTTAPLQTSPLATSKRVTTSVVDTSLPPTTPERTTTAPLQTSSAKHFPRGDDFLYRITTSTPTASTPTASTPTTSTLTTSEGETTSVLHTSPPPAERTTTAQQPTTSSQASTASPSTTHVAQTTAHDESQESQEDDSMNQISLTDLTEEESENILTLSFHGIREDDWMKNYDLKFRQFLSNTLTSNSARVEPENIYYIRPTPLLHRNALYVRILPRYSSMKRSALPFVPLNETLEALGNLTALAAALGIDTVPSIVEGVPEFLLPTTQLPTTLPTTDLPITQSLEEREPPIIQPSTTEPPIIQPSTTRKPPQKIGFLSNPGLFISLVVIATVSIIIIIVGLIYLLCDRRRGRTGEYITNHTPRNSDLELGLDNPVMAENDKNVSNGNHLSSIKGDMESDMIVPYDNFTQEELMNYEVEDTHL